MTRMGRRIDGPKKRGVVPAAHPRHPRNPRLEPLYYGQGADIVSAGPPKLFLEQSDLLLHRLLRRMRHGFDSRLGRPCLLLLLWLRLWWRGSPRLFRPRFSRLRRDLLSGSRRSFDW